MKNFIPGSLIESKVNKKRYYVDLESENLIWIDEGKLTNYRLKVKNQDSKDFTLIAFNVDIET